MGQHMQRLKKRAWLHALWIQLNSSNDFNSLLPSLVDKLFSLLLKVIVTKLRDLGIKGLIFEVIWPKVSQLFGVYS